MDLRAYTKPWIPRQNVQIAEQRAYCAKKLM